MYLQHKKKEQIMFDTNDLNKAGALWQTLGLSSASISSVFGLANPIFCSFMIQAYWLELKLNSGVNGGLAF